MIYNRFDNVNEVLYSTHTDHISPMSELIQIYDDEQLIKIMFQTAAAFQKLKLTVKEMLVILAIIITFSGEASSYELQSVLCSLDYKTNLNPTPSI